MAFNLSSRAMIVVLRISQWTARRVDQKVTREVAERHGAENRRVGEYRKNLLPEKSLEAVRLISYDARAFHYEQTLPWLDDGMRMLPSKNFLAYSERMRALRGQFDDAVKTFADNYPEYIEAARKELNGLFNEADYPDPETVRCLFEFKVNIYPIPEQSDFRIELSNDDLAAIRKDIEDRAASAVQTANKDMWERLYGVVATMASTLGNTKKFRNSLVENVVDICGLLTRLNVADDPELEAMRLRVEKELCAIAAEDLRKNAGSRDRVREAAVKIRTAIQAKKKGV